MSFCRSKEKIRERGKDKEESTEVIVFEGRRKKKRILTKRPRGRRHCTNKREIRRKAKRRRWKRSDEEDEENLGSYAAGFRGSYCGGVARRGMRRCSYGMVSGGWI